MARSQPHLRHPHLGRRHSPARHPRDVLPISWQTAQMNPVDTPLPSLSDQVDRLIDLGVPALLGQTNEDLRAAADHLSSLEVDNALLVPSSLPCDYADLMRLIVLDGKPGFVVEDFTDAASFVPVEGADSASVILPDTWYLLEDPRRGDEFSNASPAEALRDISAEGRLPLTMAEGIFWAFQNPDIIERNHCFMTIGSRKPTAKGGFDSRTPALWISNGTGRDGKDNRNAPKLGWCWWNNRHTWLGIAHAANRTG